MKAQRNSLDLLGGMSRDELRIYSWVAATVFALVAGVTLLRSVSLPLALAVSVAASFAIAELFYRYVEQPAHRLSMAVGRAVGRRSRIEARADGPAIPQPAEATSPSVAPEFAGSRSR